MALFTMRLTAEDEATLTRLQERTDWSRAQLTRKGWQALEKLLPERPVLGGDAERGVTVVEGWDETLPPDGGLEQRRVAFDRGGADWEAHQIRDASGAVTQERVRLPDGRVFINGEEQPHGE